MSQQKQSIPFEKTSDFRYIKAFIEQPSLDNFYHLHKKVKDTESCELNLIELLLAGKPPIISAVIKSFILLNKKSPDTKQAIELLSNFLSDNNIYIWNLLGNVFAKGGGRDNIKQELRHHFPPNFMQLNNPTLAAFCHSKMLIKRVNLGDAWCDVAYYIKNNGLFSCLPQEVKDAFPKKQDPLTFCYSEALMQNPENGYAWKALGDRISASTSLRKKFKTKHSFGEFGDNLDIKAACYCKALMQDDRDEQAWKSLGKLVLRQIKSIAGLPMSLDKLRNHFPKILGQLDLATLPIYCYGRALLLNDKKITNWGSIRVLVTKESFATLPQQIKDKFPAGFENQSTETLKAYCLSKEIILGATLAAWSVLARLLVVNASFMSLPQELRELFPEGSQDQNSVTLAALCSSKVLLLGDESNGWESLGIYLRNGASFASLHQETKNKFPVGYENQSAMTLSAWCYSQALIHCEKIKGPNSENRKAQLLGNLGICLSKGASFASLPQEIRNRFPAGSENQSAATLYALCLSQIMMTGYSAWVGLGFAITQGASFANLPQQIKDKFPAGSGDQSPAALSAFCYSQTLILNDEKGGAWYALAETLSQGASFVSLPQLMKDKFPKEVESKGLTSVLVFCCCKELNYHPKHVGAWRMLAQHLENGAGIADLSQELQLRFIPHIKNIAPLNLELADLCLEEARKASKTIDFQNDIDRVKGKLDQYKNLKRRLEENEQEQPPTKRARTDNANFSHARNNAASFWAEVEEEMAIEPIGIEQLATVAIVKEEPPENFMGFGGS